MDETLTDLSGFPVFCKSPEAVQLYNEVIESFCKQISGFLRELKKALKLDPEFVLARCLMVGQLGLHERATHHFKIISFLFPDLL